jgi:hypothetical protein
MFLIQRGSKNYDEKSLKFVEMQHKNKTVKYTETFQVLTAESMKMAAFRDIAPCSFVEVHSSP